MKMMMTVMSLFVLLAWHDAAQAAGKTYGKPLQLQEQTKISAILDHPETFVGKPVRVSGTVVEVCSTRGCWIDLASDRPYEKIQVKVNDGEIVFPMSASGHRATVEGTVEQLKMTKQEVIEYKKHQAEEKGEKFDPATVRGDETIVRLRGIGAVIEE